MTTSASMTEQELIRWAEAHASGPMRYPVAEAVLAMHRSLEALRASAFTVEPDADSPAPDAATAQNGQSGLYADENWRFTPFLVNHNRSLRRPGSYRMEWTWNPFSQW